MASDRLFRVLVLSGMALTAGVGCAGSAGPGDARNDTPSTTDEGLQTDSGRDAGIEEFPREGPVMLDSGSDVQPDVGIEEFPREGPIMADIPPEDAATD